MHLEHLATADIALTAVMAALALLLAWLSLMLASTEAAVTRVTRSSLNNLVLETQTQDISQFERMKRIDRIHRVQRMLVDRNATSASAAFFRILFNVLDGVLVSSIAAVFIDAIWLELLIGFVAGLVIALCSVLLRPRMTGASKPLDVMLRHSRMVAIAVALTPFARVTGYGRALRDARGDDDLSDDEALEKLHYEQGRASIDRAVEANDFDPEISEMLRNVVTLSDTLTREIMVPRTDMICIERATTLSASLKLFSRSGFSRIPVIGESVDDLIGVAYLKDAVRATAYNPEAADRPVESIVRDPLMVPESKPVDDLFHEMQRKRQHIAMVVDEYGGIAGLVTIEDALEQIVGELQDEHDRTQKAEPEQVGERAWRLPARTPIADLEELYEISIDEDDVDTVFGLLTKVIGRVPIVGASGVTHGLRLTAVDSAGRRKKVSTILVEPAGAGGERDDDHDDNEGNKENPHD